MDELIVAEHAFKHGLTAEDVRYAWENSFVAQRRLAPHEDQIVVVGLTKDGKVAELIGSQKASCIVIYHAMVPPTKRVLMEVGLVRSGK